MGDIKRFLPFLSIVCGVLNVLIIKWCDETVSEDSVGVNRRFQHPFLQTTLMFMGEIICFAIYKITFFIESRRGIDSLNSNLITKGNREFSPFIFILPSCCDVVASSMLLSALYITNASSWQMLRGIGLIFVSLFSVNYLNLKLKLHNWLGILLIIIGSVVIILYDTNYSKSHDWKGILTADLLIICSQIFQSVQYVYEEKHIKTLDIAPMHAVGWQGVFGFIQCLLILILLSFIKIDEPFKNNSNGSMEYIPDAFSQLLNSPAIVIGHVIFLFSVILYNYSSLEFMKETSSTSRIIIDSFRAAPIYLISVLVERESFNPIPIIAYIVLLSGIFFFNNIVFSQAYKWLLRKITNRNFDDMISEENVIISAADSIEG